MTEFEIIMTSALPMGFLPDSHLHKLMVNYSMIKFSPYPLGIALGIVRAQFCLDGLINGEEVEEQKKRLRPPACVLNYSMISVSMIVREQKKHPRPQQTPIIV